MDTIYLWNFLSLFEIMRSVLFFVIFGFGLFSPAFAQRNTAAKRTVGLTAYYFWEEDSMGIIYNKTIDILKSLLGVSYPKKNSVFDLNS
jgi:hypothetical protein